MDNLTDQQHIDALSEPVKDALRQVQNYGCTINPPQAIKRAIALIPAPTPEPDPVEELAAEINRAWKKDTKYSYKLNFALHYLIERGLLNMESVK